MLIPPFAEKMFPTLGKCFSFFFYFFLLERDKEILPALSLKERNPKENHSQNVPYFQFRFHTITFLQEDPRVSEENENFREGLILTIICSF